MAYMAQIITKVLNSVITFISVIAQFHLHTQDIHTQNHISRRKKTKVLNFNEPSPINATFLFQCKENAPFNHSGAQHQNSKGTLFMWTNSPYTGTL
jgi:hypothetical protein